MPLKPITCLDLSFTNLPPRAGYFVVSVHRGDWNTPDSRVRFFYRPSRASLLRVNRAQRLLIRRVVNGYVADLPTAPSDDYDAWNAAQDRRHFESLGDADTISPAVTVEPESNTELGQLVTTEYEAAQQPVRMCRMIECLDAALPDGDCCQKHTDEVRNAVSLTEWLERR